MASFLLDTNILSELMKSTPDSNVINWFKRQQQANFFTTSITQAEIYTGIAYLPNGKRKQRLAIAAEALFKEDFSKRVLPFSEDSVIAYSLLRAACRSQGRAITSEDAMIAAIAQSQSIPLVTRNTKDFDFIDNLKLVNPFKS